MSSDKLSALAGVVLSLAFSYVPGLKTWFGGLPSIGKRLVMLAALLLVSAGAFGLSCAGVLDGALGTPAVLCEQRGALEIAWAFVAAMVANQAAYQLSPASSDKA